MIYRNLRYVSALLLLAGIASLLYAFCEGPASWTTDARTFWGFPIALFVFWIGISHAGTFISAILLVLDVKVDRKTSLLAELSTLCAFSVACIFPIVHLGIPSHFHMVIPLLDSRGNFANLRSPLTWDLCCICIYGILSFAYFIIHLKNDSECFRRLRLSMAWILFPLVIWVHTVVSLDFAVTLVPEWRGAFFPPYFVAGAIYSGIATVNALLCVENQRALLLEKLQLALSFLMLFFWMWNYLLKGDFSFSVAIFGFVIPQLLWIPYIRQCRIFRLLISFSIVVCLLLERIILVMPDFAGCVQWIDAGFVALGSGAFLFLFATARISLRKSIDSFDDLEKAENTCQYKKIFRDLRKPLLVGGAIACVYAWWAVSEDVYDNVNLKLYSVIPMLYPIIAFVSAVILCLKQLLNLCEIKSKLLLFSVLVLLGFALGAFYAGGKSVSGNLEFSSSTSIAVENLDSSEFKAYSALLWESRCSACHGNDGNFNEKFIREYYPVPQKLSSVRFDSLGEDSLMHVVLYGRINMNPYKGRLSETEVRGLVRYMRELSVLNETLDSHEKVVDDESVR